VAFLSTSPFWNPDATALGGYFQPTVAQRWPLLVYLGNNKGGILLSGQSDYCAVLIMTEAECNELI